MSRKIRIGSRKSRLAVIQTELVMDTIRETHPEIELELITMETTGDRRLDVTLDKIGGKGLFVKELDRALLEGRIDLAVHSLKDMPMEESSRIPILGYTKREDVRDVLVLPEGGKPWEGRGVIGCSSFRRRIQGERLFPQAEFRSIRGNVLTRLEKLDRGEYDALILAAAGLNWGLNIGSAGIFLRKRSFRRPDRGFWLSRDAPERIMGSWRLWQRRGPGRKLWQREHLSGIWTGDALRRWQPMPE